MREGAQKAEKMPGTVRYGFIAGFFAVLIGVGYSAGESLCAPDRTQHSGSIYRICMPPAKAYNGSLVIWAHGFQDAGTPVQIPEDQLQLGDMSIPAIINQLGFGFATNSYSKTGLAVRQGMADILDLVDIYSRKQGAPEHVYLTGASEGGLITALLVEQHPDIFTAGVAACGPVGSFPYQLRYFGNARATFQYFFPALIPGDPFAPSQELISDWSNYYDTVVQPAVFAPAHRHRLDQWVKVARLPYDADRYLETVADSVRDVLRYAVVNLDDAVQTLGGFPFDNSTTQYSGSTNDARLNRLVPRRSADPAALTEMHTFYNTTGRLERTLVTLHTVRDQQVPYRHEVLYKRKTLASWSLLVEHINMPVPRFGHCNFTSGEAIGAFTLMLRRAGKLELLSGVGTILHGEDLAAFERLAHQHSIPYQVAGQGLQAVPRHR
jgi:pimeloyl-ACP methyl ester carboxylesterase